MENSRNIINTLSGHEKINIASPVIVQQCPCGVSELSGSETRCPNP
jgi:hypothetical protein